MFGGVSSSRPGKRQRLSEFRPGSVIKIEVKNFMTYAHAVIEPGPRLNLVLGPNGTGKSSLVCALCVGLAGGTKLLGRAEDVSSFVRRGTDVGETIITLAGQDSSRTITIRRRITVRDNSSKWWLNGVESKYTEVVALVKSLNIQLDNLCQFLPQDKVPSFAGMKPIELLNATEAAVGDASLAAMHAELIEERATLRAEDAAIAEISQELDRLRQENDRTEKTLAPIRERDRLVREAEELRLKVPWAEYAQAKVEYTKEKEGLKNIEKSYNIMKARQEEQDAPLRAKKQAALAAEAKEKKAKEAATKADISVKVRGKDRIEIVDALVEDAATAQEKVDNLANDARTRLAKIAAAKAAIVSLESNFEDVTAALVPNAANEQRKVSLAAQKKDLETQELALSDQMDECKAAEDEALRAAKVVEAQLARLDDAKERRMRMLDQRHAGIRNAWEWVQANRQRFRGPVLGPIAMEVEVSNPVHAAMLEQHIPNTWWSHFVVQYQEDQDLLRRELQDQCRYRPNITYYRGDPAAQLRSLAGPAADYRRYGVQGSLDEMFHAPSLVKHVLNDNHYIASAFVMGSNDANWEALYGANPRLQVVWTPDSQIRRRTSQYNKDAVSTTVMALRSAYLLASGGMSDANGGAERPRLEARLHELTVAAEEASAPIRNLDSQLADVRERVAKVVQEQNSLSNDMTDLLKKQRALKTRIVAKTNELAKLEATPDPLSCRGALEKEAVKAREKAASAACQLAEAYATAVKLNMAHTAAELAFKELSDQVEKMAAANKSRTDAIEQTGRLVADYKRNVASCKANCDALHAKAKETTGWPLPEGLEDRFKELSSSPSELLRQAQELTDEAQGVVISDPSAMQRYKQRCDDIARGEGQLGQARSRRELCAAKVEQLKAQWVPELRAIVETINHSFSKAFPAVGVAGEVALHEAPDDDFANYAIEIRVKFREGEPLATLDSNRQSGGERSASTILYLVALQGVAAAPFRVVDEINQGMDASNERKVFRQLVDAATAEGTPQCFLLTPKLLPDLPFSSEVTVLHIMNGVHIEDVATGYRQECLMGARRMQMLAARG